MPLSRTHLSLSLLAGGIALAVVAAAPGPAAPGPRAADRVTAGQGATAGQPAADGPAAAARQPALPARLRDTGLHAESEGGAPGADLLPFTPQYPLWSDGATKRRWLWLPPGSAIDASRPDAWEFPVGTRLWKEFSFGGRPVETRTMELTAGGWVYGTYAWNAEGTEAVLAPERGARSVEIAPGVRHTIPGLAECRACHAGAPSPVLGLSALQISPDRDPGALHAEAPAPGSVDLPSLVAAGKLRGLPPALLREPPRIAARTPLERAALGYLHGNCGGCHNPGGSLAALDLSLVYPVGDGAAGIDPLPPARRTTESRPSRFPPPGAGAGTPSLRIAPGAPEASVLLARMRTRNPSAQMPPMGTALVDHQAIDLIDRWITGRADPTPEEREP